LKHDNPKKQDDKNPRYLIPSTPATLASSRYFSPDMLLLLILLLLLLLLLLCSHSGTVPIYPVEIKLYRHGPNHSHSPQHHMHTQKRKFN
jgi:hypothetical protein